MEAHSGPLGETYQWAPFHGRCCFYSTTSTRREAALLATESSMPNANDGLATVGQMRNVGVSSSTACHLQLPLLQVLQTPPLLACVRARQCMRARAGER
eukprot:12715522-Alexandrium_andersonii.AAC.1